MTLSTGKYDVPADHIATVITTLEMTAPTMANRLLFPDGVSARKESLSLDAFRTIFRKIGAPWLWTSGLSNPDEEIIATLTDPNVDYWIIYEDQNAIGLVELDFRKTGTCELVLFGMVTEATGQGLGGPMMALAQSEAFARDITRFHVCTCHLDSPQALPFYLKAGFTPVKRTVEVFPDPRLSGHHPPDTAPHVPCLT
ncbi:acetyltransferase (GNAT) family protein [Yoonia maricola]|uniref:Acetyltransferase (GNAT) family protein n=1 Tax=Yoonia maricola TaxID=420999 RepID=A0A2M8WL25_9RHOB|nr:GNAT family N-acetyltransferase [Yoonia maricola]PJI91619.1 acetyltransferase (GNAT) family protein [Yoonia maricola]